jgi:hypothetical protein
MAVYETTVSERGQPDWEQEVRFAAAGTAGVLQRRGYMAPRNMRWDGVYGKPDAVAEHDLFCFVLSAYKDAGQPADVAVYQVSQLLGRTHTSDGVPARHLAAGRPGWTNRYSAAVELLCVGFVRRDRFCAALGRSHRAPQRTQVCKDATHADVLNSLDVHVEISGPGVTMAATSLSNPQLKTSEEATRGVELESIIADQYRPRSSPEAHKPALPRTPRMVLHQTALPKRKDRPTRAERATGWGGRQRRKRKKNIPAQESVSADDSMMGAVTAPLTNQPQDVPRFVHKTFLGSFIYKQLHSFHTGDDIDGSGQCYTEAEAIAYATGMEGCVGFTFDQFHSRTELSGKDGVAWFHRKVLESDIQKRHQDKQHLYVIVNRCDDATRVAIATRAYEDHASRRPSQAAKAQQGSCAAADSPCESWAKQQRLDGLAHAEQYGTTLVPTQADKLRTAEKAAVELATKLSTAEKAAAELAAKLSTAEKAGAKLAAKLSTAEKAGAELTAKLSTAEKAGAELAAKLSTAEKAAAELRGETATNLEDLQALGILERKIQSHAQAALANVNQARERLQECTVCMEAHRDTTFLPCRHCVCCWACSIKQPTCPICREQVTDRVQSLLS